MHRALGYRDVRRFHLNDGHAALLAQELLDEHARWFGRERFDDEEVQAIRPPLCLHHSPPRAGGTR